MKSFAQMASELLDLKTRVERLETLEFHNKAIGLGCIDFIDEDHGFKAQFQVDVTNPVGQIYPYSQLTLFWNFKHEDFTPKLHPLYCIVNAQGGALYHYAYSYTKGGATTDVGADGQRQWIVGRIPRDAWYHWGIGRIDVPLYCWDTGHKCIAAFGEWSVYETEAESGSRMERGNWGGDMTYSNVPTSFRFILPGYSQMEGAVYLYGWCPENDQSNGGNG